MEQQEELIMAPSHVVLRNVRGGLDVRGTR